MQKNADAFRTISEVADELALPQHVLRFWETRFPQIRPLKRAGGRRYYRPGDITLLKSIRALLYDEGYTIKGVQRLLKEQGPKGAVKSAKSTDADEYPPVATDAQLETDDDDRSIGVMLADQAEDDDEGSAIGTPGADVSPVYAAPDFQPPEARQVECDVYGARPGAVFSRAPAPAGLLGSLQRDALETALMVIEDCERVLAPLLRRPV